MSKRKLHIMVRYCVYIPEAAGTIQKSKQSPIQGFITSYEVSTYQI